MNITLLAYTQGQFTAEHLAEYAGRVCYRSTDKLGTDPQWLSKRLEQGHESIIEHVSFTFEIDGITRACANQLERHRLASYSQESLRYCDASNLAVIMPDAVKENDYARVLWEQTTKHLFQVYGILVECGIKREDARGLLPLNTETRLIMTVNARELLHIAHLRLSTAAQEEIRQVVQAMVNLAAEVMPEVFRGISTVDKENDDKISDIKM